MNTDRIVRRELLALLGSGNAHMGFDEAVAGFPMEHINTRAPHVPYSPWHFLEHMRIAQWDILEFIRNPDHVSPDYPEGYRPRPDAAADEGRWRQTLAGFRADLQALQDMVAAPAIDLMAPIPHAPDYTIFREILTIADHNAYHMGEFAILRQVLDNWPQDNKYLTGAP